ncbi:hypothetical protein Q5P01_024336 [Channa striata]|uniref:Sepiapterin reductase n=1 Tax=Channa striata TaxID=64152 RepID=A0AA88J7P7_CHASR|nr:hypothetical protein Q5P01_024336 [Channa striata]
MAMRRQAELKENPRRRRTIRPLPPDEKHFASSHTHTQTHTLFTMAASERTTDLGRALCIITGASRGFGRTVARDVARLVEPGSALVLVARSGDELRALQAELVQSEAGRAGLVVECAVADLGDVDGLESVVRTSEKAFAKHMDHVLLVNNAASLGDVSRYAKSFTNMAEVDSYLSLNVSSSLCLTAKILQAFPQRPGLRRTVINVSSLCALQPFRSWVLYCTGKAAREMMFRVLAEESQTSGCSTILQGLWIRTCRCWPDPKQLIPVSGNHFQTCFLRASFSPVKSPVPN